MPRIEFEGMVHEFPEDFKETDIASALASMGPKQPEQQPQLPPDLKSRKLSSRDKGLAQQVALTPDERKADEEYDLSLVNFNELEKEIDRTKSKPARAVLEAEHSRLKGELVKHLFRVKYGSSN